MTYLKLFVMSIVAYIFTLVVLFGLVKEAEYQDAKIDNWLRNNNIPQNINK